MQLHHLTLVPWMTEDAASATGLGAATTASPRKALDTALDLP